MIRAVALRLPGTVASAKIVRYGIGSVVALVEDVALFVTLLGFGMPSVSASVIAYLFGIFVHWFVSSRFAFAGSVAVNGPERTRQKGMFLATALIGLLITTGIMTLAGLLGILPVVAKAVAIVVSFQATYMLRKAMVFTA